MAFAGGSGPIVRTGAVHPVLVAVAITLALAAPGITRDAHAASPKAASGKPRSRGPVSPPAQKVAPPTRSPEVPLPEPPPSAPSSPATRPTGRPPPGKLSVAVFPLEAKGIPAPIAELTTEQVVMEMRQCKVFDRVASPSEVAVLLPPAQQRELVSCANDRCAVVDREIAGALGVTHLAVGSVGRLGSKLVVTLKILELSTALEVGTVMETAAGGDDDALLGTARWAVVRLAETSGLLAQAGPEAQAYFRAVREAETRRTRLRGVTVGVAAAGSVGVLVSFLAVVPAASLVGASGALELWMYAPAAGLTAPPLRRGRLFPAWVLASAGVGAVGLVGVALSLGLCGTSWVAAVVGASLRG